MPSEFRSSWYYWFYTKYEQYDESRIRALSDIEKDTYLYTKWNLPWPMSNTLMNIDDVATDEIVEAYASTDKWVTLPLYGTTQRQPYRRNTSSCILTAYLFEEGQDFKTNMYNEPVLLMRLMKVDDNGTATQTAPDGTALQVLHHHASSETISKESLTGRYEYLRTGNLIGETFLNNQPYKLPELPKQQ
jgi:hypothetical protein